MCVCLILCAPTFPQALRELKPWALEVIAARQTAVEKRTAELEVYRLPLREPCESNAQRIQQQRRLDDQRRRALRDAEQALEMEQATARIHVSCFCFCVSMCDRVRMCTVWGLLCVLRHDVFCLCVCVA